MRRVLSRLWRAERPDRYGLLLVLLVVLFLVLMLQKGDGWPQRSAAALLAGYVMFQAGRTSGVRARTMQATLGLLTVGILLVVATGGVLDDAGRALGALVIGVMLVGAPLVILRRILGHPEVDLQTIAGAICVYLLIGIVFAAALSTADGFTAAELMVPPARGTSDYAYASFVTLTTVGFGDLVAAGRLGRAILVLDALVGQVFLVTLVARLVAMFGHGRPASGTPGGPGGADRP